jgi:hypothetical protein
LARNVSGRGGRSPWVSLLTATAVALIVFVVDVSSPMMTIADSRWFVPAAISVVHDHTLNIAWAQTVPGAGGPEGLYRKPHDPTAPVYPYYPLGPVLIAMPVIGALDFAHAHLGLGQESRAQVESIGTWKLERIIAGLVVAITAAVLWFVAFLWFPGSTRKRRLLATAFALTFAFATDAWDTASRALWQHGPSMLMLSLLLFVIVRARTDERWLRLVGLVLGLAYLMRPSNAAALVVFTIWMLVAHRKYLRAHFAGLAVVVVPLALANHQLYGSVLAPYYRPGAQGGNPHILEALAGDLISPSRGLFVFSPVLLLGVVGAFVAIRKRTFDSGDVAIWTVIILHWLLISTSDGNWWGGFSIGPRLFTDVEPLLLYSALPAIAILIRTPLRRARAVERLAVAFSALLVVVGVAVQFEGATMLSVSCWNLVPVSVDAKPSRVWNLRNAQVTAGYRSLLHGNSFSSESADGGAVDHPCT